MLIFLATNIGVGAVVIWKGTEVVVVVVADDIIDVVDDDVVDEDAGTGTVGVVVRGSVTAK